MLLCYDAEPPDSYNRIVVQSSKTAGISPSCLSARKGREGEREHMFPRFWRKFTLAHKAAEFDKREDHLMMIYKYVFYPNILSKNNEHIYNNVEMLDDQRKSNIDVDK